MRYQARSLVDIAEHFDERSRIARAKLTDVIFRSKRSVELHVEAATWEAAADIIRQTEWASDDKRPGRPRTKKPKGLRPVYDEGRKEISPDDADIVYEDNRPRPSGPKGDTL